MENDVELGIATMFRDATMESIVHELRTPGDWDEFNKIKDQSRQHEQDEHEYFRKNWTELFTEARKELIDKAGSRTFEHPTPFGSDRFSTASTDEQARAKIENDHKARILAIRKTETDGFGALRDSIETREGMRDRAREAFARTIERHQHTRSGPHM